MATLNNPRGMVTTLAIFLIVIVATVVTLFWRQTVPTPSAEPVEVITHLGTRAQFPLRVSAHRGRVAEVEVRVLRGDRDVLAQSIDLRDQDLEEGVVDVDFDTKSLGIGEGEAILVIRVRDDFKRVREPDAIAAEIPVTIDLTPPRLTVASATRYVDPGGTGVAVLRATDAKEVAVVVGERRFKAYAAPSAAEGSFVAFYALGIDHRSDDIPVAEARDAAGNVARRQLPVVLRDKPVRTGNVPLSMNWMRNKLPDLLPDRTDWSDEHLKDAFLEVSVDQRAQAAKIRQDLADASAPAPTWRGVFAQLPNSQAMSKFGVRRTYTLDGQALDEQVHQGYDLASFKHAPIPAANAGRVVFAGPLMLYGEAVILDHGLGLLTLYGHCSSLEVSVGDEVERGQIIAHTGATGLAGGDHLHFEVIVGGVPVSPLEWWDRAWIEDRVVAVLRDGGVTEWLR